MNVVRPVHECHLECVFHNISKQALSMESSLFHLPGISNKWWVKIYVTSDSDTVKTFRVGINKSHPHGIIERFLYNYCIQNIQGEIWKTSEKKISLYENYKFAEYDTRVCVDSISSIKDQFQLPEDKLVVKTDFVISKKESSPLNSIFQMNVIDDLKKMYESGSDSDITFSLDDGELNAHKSIIKSRCPAFSTMLNQLMVEKETNRVVIKDIDHQVFDCFLHFLYTGEIKDDSADTVLGVYYVADKYLMSSLKKACSEMLLSKLDEKNVLPILILSYRHGDSELKKHTLSYLSFCLGKVYSTDEWNNAVEEFPAISTDVLECIAKPDK